MRGCLQFLTCIKNQRARAASCSVSRREAARPGLGSGSRVMKIAVPDTRISDCGLRSRRNKESGSASARTDMGQSTVCLRHHVSHDRECESRGDNRKPTTFNDLQQVGTEKQHIDDCKYAEQRNQEPNRPPSRPKAKYVKPRIVSTSIVPVTATP